MMNVSALREALRRVEHFPGFVFTIAEGHPEGLILRIEATFVNSYDTSTFQDQKIESFLPPFRHEEDFFDWLAWRLARVAIHEALEFFKVDGKPYTDPHASDYIGAHSA